MDAPGIYTPRNRKRDHANFYHDYFPAPTSAAAPAPAAKRQRWGADSPLSTLQLRVQAPAGPSTTQPQMVHLTIHPDFLTLPAAADPDRVGAARVLAVHVLPRPRGQTATVCVDMAYVDTVHDGASWSAVPGRAGDPAWPVALDQGDDGHDTPALAPRRPQRLPRPVDVEYPWSRREGVTIGFLAVYCFALHWIIVAAVAGRLRD